MYNIDSIEQLNIINFIFIPNLLDKHLKLPVAGSFLNIKSNPLEYERFNNQLVGYYSVILLNIHRKLKHNQNILDTLCTLMLHYRY